MNTNDTCTVTLTLAQAKLVRRALLTQWGVINADKFLSPEKVAEAVANIDVTIDQLDLFIAAAKKVAA